MPIHVVHLFLTRIQASGNRGEMPNSLEIVDPKSKIIWSRLRECAGFSNGKEKILSEQRDIFIISLKGKLIKPSKATLLRQSYLKRSLNWTEENGRCKMQI